MREIKYKCGCVVDAYWCANHDIYGVEASKAPWGRAGNGNSTRNREVPIMSEQEGFNNEEDYDGEERSCSCHINPPCSKCCQ